MNTLSLICITSAAVSAYVELMLMKKLSKYIVNINKTDFKTLADMGVVSEKKEGLFVVDYKQQYDEHIGLRTDNNWANEILIQ